MQNTIVEFIKHSGQYNVGTVAHFPDPTAQALIKAGVAKLYQFPAGQLPVPEKGSFVNKMVKKAAD